MYAHFAFSDELESILKKSDPQAITDFFLSVICHPYLAEPGLRFNGKFLTAIINGYIQGHQQYATRVDNDFPGQLGLVLLTQPLAFVMPLLKEYEKATTNHPELFPTQEEPIPLTMDFFERLFERPVTNEEAIVVSMLLSTCTKKALDLKFGDLTGRDGERLYFMMVYFDEPVEGSAPVEMLKDVQFDEAGIVKH